ncbi:T7SS effector LXG polymorphic toxin [Bacillus vallismortis]|uniref:T7SS effector LXG polymorphic toxin n=1 Tax=Bacillus vallismortis TaxID=72361 RepID=UPI0013EB5703|nr:T7SS effector LXG polymorphic toxin [Bacillus vallismortis]MEC1270149.1 T7SS effector LXG polymorphic toxin [Bacillus vallismortis]
MKTLEANTILEAAETRLKAYQTLREHMAVLKKQFKEMANLDDAMTGKGANAIKAFYKEQAAGAELWLDLIDMRIAFFKNVPAAIEEATFDDDAYVEESYLDNELHNGLVKADGIIEAQHKEMKSILNSIDDILPLSLFDQSTVTDKLDKADKKRKKTVTHLHDLDEKLNSDYEASEAVEHEVRAFFEALTGATSKGGSTNPMNFNAKAFHETDAYQNKEDIHKQSQQFIKAKKQEEIEYLMKKLDKTTDPEEYLKIADKIGTDNLNAEQLQYYSSIVQMKAQQETGKMLVEGGKGVIVGLWDAGKDIVTGACDLAVGAYDLAVWSYRAQGKMGIEEQVKAGQELQNVIYSAPETFEYMVDSFKTSWNDNMVHGDVYSRSHYITYALASLFGAKGLGKVSSATKAGKFVTKETKAFVNDHKSLAKNITDKAKPYFTLPNNNHLEPAIQGAGGFENPVSKLKKELDKKQESVMRFDSDQNLKSEPSKKLIAQLSNVENFRPKALEHIFEGEVNYREAAVGYHYEGLDDTAGKVISGTKTDKNEHGVYKGKVEVNGKKKFSNNGFSTFFPEEWTPQQVVDSINEAYENKEFIPGTKNTYEGRTKDNLRIRMFIDSNGKIISSFPIYP